MKLSAWTSTVDILREFVEDDSYRVYGTTNWSAETFPIALKEYEFRQWFEGIVVSGVEKCKKPEDKIYNILLKRYRLIPDESLFIDDSKKNVLPAEKLGIRAIHFHSPEQLKEDLKLILTS